MNCFCERELNHEKVVFIFFRFECLRFPDQPPTYNVMQIESALRQKTIIIAPYQRSHFVGLCISNHEAVCWQLKRVCYDCGAISGRGSLLYGAARLGLARRPVQPVANTSAWRRRPPSWAAAAMRLRGSPVSKITMPFGAPARASLSSWPSLHLTRRSSRRGPHPTFFSQTAPRSTYPQTARYQRGRMRFRLPLYQIS